MVDILRIPADKVPTLRRHYFETYGTTLRGLQRHYDVDTDDFLKFVHDLALHEYLRPQTEVAQLIASLPQRKYIFTNADEAHASRVLSMLQMEGLFLGVIDVRAMDFHCKPEPEAYKIALNLAGNPDPQACLMIDDSQRNLEPAQALGFKTIHVTHEMPSSDGHLSISNLCELTTTLPALWVPAQS